MGQSVVTDVHYVPWAVLRGCPCQSTQSVVNDEAARKVQCVLGLTVYPVSARDGTSNLGMHVL